MLNIPENVLKCFDKKFLEQFYNEIHCIVGLGLDDFEMDTFFQIEGTSAYNTAFLNTCKKLKAVEVIQYIKTLTWEESDLLDDFILDKLKEIHLVLPDFEDDEICRQYGYQVEDVVNCIECGNFFLKKDMELYKDEYIDENDSHYYICPNCSKENNKELQPIKIDRKKCIQHYLGLTENDFFYCDNCKKYHLNKFKQDNRFCHYCNIQMHSKYEHANSYYRRALSETTKWFKEIK